MDKTYPAIEVRCDDPDLVLAIADEFSPTALEERGDAVRVFFATATDRDSAQRALATRYDVSAVEVSDEDWARRSQANLEPITIGRLTVFPSALCPLPSALSIVIQPSMGFGTGHHATTRLCLEALQAIDLRSSTVVDVGTGSGILAIAAVRLGAARAVGIDVDADAVHAACENLALNPEVANRTSFEVRDLSSIDDDTFSFDPDVVTANLTGAMLVRCQADIENLPRRHGMLILSGLQLHERDEVVGAFAGTTVVWERSVDEWVALAMKRT